MFNRFKNYLLIKKERKLLKERLDRQAVCLHHEVDRRLVIDSMTNPGRKEVICLGCGTIKIFENGSIL